VKKGVRYRWSKANSVENAPNFHAVLFRCVKQCPVFFRGCLLRFRDITYLKDSYLLSHQRAIVKMLISHKIQQNVDFTQRASSKMLISLSGQKQLKC